MRLTKEDLETALKECEWYMDDKGTIWSPQRDGNITEEVIRLITYVERITMRRTLNGEYF